MPLTKCPDCAQDVSPSALACPHCGRPTGGAKLAGSQIRRGALSTIGAIAALGALVVAYKLLLAPVDFGERPSAFVGTWEGTNSAGNHAVMVLKANGRYTEVGNPGNPMNASGIWGVFPHEDPTFVRFCFARSDGSDKACTPVSPIPSFFLSPSLYVHYERR